MEPPSRDVQLHRGALGCVSSCDGGFHSSRERDAVKGDAIFHQVPSDSLGAPAPEELTIFVATVLVGRPVDQDHDRTLTAEQFHRFTQDRESSGTDCGGVRVEVDPVRDDLPERRRWHHRRRFGRFAFDGSSALKGARTRLQEEAETRHQSIAREHCDPSVVDAAAGRRGRRRRAATAASLP